MKRKATENNPYNHRHANSKIVQGRVGISSKGYRKSEEPAPFATKPVEAEEPGLIIEFEFDLVQVVTFVAIVFVLIQALAS